MNRLHIFSLLLLFAGCSGSEQEYALPEFKETRTAQFVPLSEEDLPIKGISGMDVYEDNLIVYGVFQDHFIHIYDKHTGLLKTRCLKPGRGPGEAIAPRDLHLDKTSGQVVFLDSGTKTVNTFAIDDVLRGEFPKVESSEMSSKWSVSDIELPGGRKFAYNQVSFLSKDGATPRMTLWENGTETDRYTEFPFDIGDTTANGQFTLYQQCHIKASPDFRKLAVGVLSKGLLLETFDLSGKRIEAIGTGRFVEPAFLNPGTGRIYGFSALCVTDRYIFGAMSKDIHTPDYERIALFDWKCRPLKAFDTDRSVYALAADDTDGSIYAVVKDDNGMCWLARLDRTFK
ncbi:MAG: hypothetical protein J6K95_06615 [Rikenellaceae bacterium]|nr:hypothetical protein [Rikenellaceae bacterium]